MEAAVVVIDACAWPVLTRLSPDRVGLVHFNRSSHGLEAGDLAALISDDEGRTWQPAGLPAPHDPGANRMHIAAGVAHDGRWVVLSTGFKVVDGKYTSLEPLWSSSGIPGAEPWRVCRDVHVGGATSHIIPHGRILAMPDGRLAASFYRSWGRGHPSRAWIAFSSDSGVTWGGAQPVGGEDVNEIGLLRQRDGRMLAAARTHIDHHVALHASADGVSPWHFQSDLTLPMQHPADLTDLGDAGILLTYGIRNRGLMGLGLRLSRNGGETWGAPAVLYQFGEATDCGYPSTLALRDGGMLTACYTDRSSLHDGYHLLTLHWHLDEFFAPQPLRAMSDGGPLKV